MTNQAFNLSLFEDRDSETNYIVKQCEALRQGNRPTNPQFIEFNGVWGIGKTTMLRKIEHDCLQANLPHLWIEASDTPAQAQRKIATQIRDRYHVSFKSRDDKIAELFQATRDLQTKYGAAVVLIDSLDAAGEDFFELIEELLHRFKEISKLLFILASRNKIDFKNKALTRGRHKLFLLDSFSHTHCIPHIAKLTQKLNDEDIDQVIQLTSGYPIAVDVAVDTITQENLNVAIEQDRYRLVQIIYERVIKQGILAGIQRDPDQLLWYQTVLGLLAVPRRFNLALMQKIIERFIPEYTFSSKLLSMSLHKRIHNQTGLLDWHEARIGYSMAQPVRHLFLVHWKMENPEKYAQIHEFLMEQNWQLAMEVPGADKVLYIQEYLYHSAFGPDNTKIQERIDKAMEQILKEEALELIVQFEEEYKNDSELSEALGALKDEVLAKIYRYLASSWQKQATTTADSSEKVDLWLSYVRYSIKDPTVATSARLERARHCLQVVKAQEGLAISRSLAEAVRRDVEIKELLNSDPETWFLE